MSKLSVLKEYKRSIITFIDELIDQFPTEGDLVMIRIFLNDQIPIDDIMKAFCYDVNKNDGEIRKFIKERDDKYFLDHNIFDGFGGKSKANHFKKLWRSSELDDDDKNTIWRWIDSFVYLSDKYAKCEK